MASGRFQSIHARLLGLLLALAAAVWAGVAFTAWKEASEDLNDLLDAHLVQAASMLQAQAEEKDDDITNAPIVHKFVNRVSFQVFIGDQLVSRSARTGLPPMGSQPEGFASVSAADGQLWRVYSTWQGNSPAVHVVVGERESSRQDIMWAILRSMLGPILLGLPLMASVVWWSVRRGLEPVKALGRTLEQRCPSALDAFEVEHLPTELQPMVQALNALLQRIAQNVELERRFTADAAHELRTPIAAIRAQAQVALGAGDDEQERQHALRQTLAGCDRAARLIDQLLTLARLDSSSVVSRTVRPEGQELGQIARQVVDRLEPEAQRRHQRIDLHISTQGRVAADEVLAGVLVRNLLDNALRYSPRGAQVRVDVQEARGGGTELLVQDSGPGMSDEAMARLGERFFRVLGSEQTGSGLGWSIVRRLTEVFGARVAVQRSALLGGLAVRVVWPPVSLGPGGQVKSEPGINLTHHTKGSLA